MRVNGTNCESAALMPTTPTNTVAFVTVPMKKVLNMQDAKTTCEKIQSEHRDTQGFQENLFINRCNARETGFDGVQSSI